MKRSSDVLEGSATNVKRQKSSSQADKPIRIRHLQPGVPALLDNPQDASIFERELDRAITVGLYGAGFNAVQKSALESFRAVAEEYMHRLSHQLASVTNHCRRTQPIPSDFSQTLSSFNLPLDTLLPELNLKVPTKITQEPILPAAPDTLPSAFSIPAVTTVSLPTSDPQDLRSNSKSKNKEHIPHHLPTFPSTHTFHSTPVFINRETDALRVRERAQEEGKQAEAALRKLMRARKGDGREEGGRRWGGRDEEASRRSEEIYGEALRVVRALDRKNNAAGVSGSVGAGDGAAGNAGKEEEEGDELMGPANYDRLFWRKGRR